MARANQAGFVLIEIDDRQKIGRQRSVFALQRKIFLVVAHDRDQNFLRQLQIGRIESAQNRRGIFVEIGHQVHEVRILVNPKPLPAGQAAQFPFNLLLAVLRPDQHEIGAQFLDVIFCAAHWNLCFAEETVPGRMIPSHGVA